MKLICLFAQRKCSYPGEFAPELLAAADEFSDDENPYYLSGVESEAEKDSSIDFIKRIEVVVSDDDFYAVFVPINKIPGNVVKQ